MVISRIPANVEIQASVHGKLLMDCTSMELELRITLAGDTARPLHHSEHNPALLSADVVHLDLFLAASKLVRHRRPLLRVPVVSSSPPTGNDLCQVGVGCSRP